MLDATRAIPTLRRIRAVARAGAFACALVACSMAASVGSHGASSGIVVSMDVPSSISITNGCTGTGARQFGTVQPGTESTTATGAGVCSVSWSSSNDSSMLRVAQRDGAAPAMTQASGLWNTGIAGVNDPTSTIAAYDTSMTMASGRQNGIWRTVDGGTSWTNGPSPLGWEWSFDIEPVPGDHDRWVVVGGHGSIGSTTNAFTSAPGAPTWTSHKAALLASGWPASINVTGVAVATATSWRLVGFDGWVAVTTDAGASFTSWQQQTGGNYYDIDHIGGNSFIIVGSFGRVLTTSTGGTTPASWTNHDHAPPVTLLDLSVGDATHVYIVSDTGMVTRWNGTTFTDTWAFDNSDVPYSVSASTAAPGTVFVGTGFGRIQRSTDSAATFTGVDTAITGRVSAISAASATSAMAGASTGTVLATTNGTAWNVSRTGAGSPSWEDVATNPSNGQQAIAVGSGGAIRRTTDGGTTWSPIASGTTAHLFGVSWSTSSVAWAVGAGGTILRSTNGGTSWTVVATGGPQLYSVTSTSPSAAIATGRGGRITTTSNGGTSWIERTSGTSATLVDVDAASDLVAWTVGGGDRILRTTDGGVTWTQATTAPVSWASMVAVTAVDGSTVLALSASEGLYRSTDGGVTFTKVLEAWDTDYGQGDVDADASSAMQTSQWGAVRRSTDGGATWSLPEQAGATVDVDRLRSIAVASAHAAYAVSDETWIGDTDETALAAGRISDYGGANVFGGGAGVNAFGMCVQALGAGTSIAAPYIVDPGGTCTAVATDPWVAVPTTPTKVATAAAPGTAARADFVWGVKMKSDQPPGAYHAGIVFEAVAPSA